MMRSVASGGFEYLENIICYDRTCLRSVGIGTHVTTRDFGQVTSIKLQREQLRVDRAVGNHTEYRTAACHAKPETREKRSGNSRPTTCDASTTPDLKLKQERKRALEYESGRVKLILLKIRYLSLLNFIAYNFKRFLFLMHQYYRNKNMSTLITVSV